MGSYYKNWEEYGTLWKQILDGIEPLINELSEAWGGEIARERSDAPEFDLRWYTGDIGRAIQVLIEGAHENWVLFISLSAWRDLEKPQRVRVWKAKKDLYNVLVSVPPDESKIRELRSFLKKAYDTVLAWDESKLVENPLPPDAPNLTGKVFRGRYIP